jgi:hypothetical protein
MNVKAPDVSPGAFGVRSPAYLPFLPLPLPLPLPFLSFATPLSLIGS